MPAKKHPTNEFRESGLIFRFSEDWVIRKYDDHKFYRGLSSVGLRAVDFIGLYRNHRAVFIEVKNYRQRSPKKAIEILQDPEPFIDYMVRKVEDTRVGIRAIHGYFKRKWLYRLIYQRLLRLPLSRWKNYRWVYWAQLYNYVWEKQRIDVVFWLDFLEAYDGVSHEQLQQSRQRIEAGLKARLQEHGCKVRILTTGDEVEGMVV